ncbi:MAG: MFS transporter [Acidimicrobiia bacterium]|nr:MFS transporter [Acidimicrobiia bacterium]
MRSFLQAEGVKTFSVVWFGQLISLLGSSMTRFGLAIWVYQETGSATQLALIVMASRVPMLLVSPFVGALVDRWDRRTSMLVADTGAAIGTLATMLLVVTGSLEIWHLYLTLSFSGLFAAFQFPAYSAAVTVLIPKEHYARASGMVQLAGSVGGILAPALAAAIVVTAGLGPLFIADAASYVVAVTTLLVVRFPRVEASERRGRGITGLLREAGEGLSFITARRGLLILLLSFVMVNFAFAFQGVLTIPLLLNLTSEQTAGLIVSLGAGGVAVGSLTLAVWGGPKKKILGVYLPIMAMGVGLVMMGLRPSVWLVAAGLLVMLGTHPIAGGSSQTIWQAKVPPQLQGRVFAIRQISAISASPIAFLSAGLLADRVFEPMFATDGSMLTAIFGSGPGRGIGFLFACTGIVAIAITIWALRHPRIRQLDHEILDADHEQALAV